MADLAFDAVDADESNTLENEELAEYINQVSATMGIKPPSSGDIGSMMNELDVDENGNLDKEEFRLLIELVFDKMLSNEEELIKNIDSEL